MLDPFVHLSINSQLNNTEFAPNIQIFMTARSIQCIKVWRVHFVLQIADCLASAAGGKLLKNDTRLINSYVRCIRAKAGWPQPKVKLTHLMSSLAHLSALFRWAIPQPVVCLFIFAARATGKEEVIWRTEHAQSVELARAGWQAARQSP